MVDRQFPIPGPRIAVVGVTGSGKTTLALRLADLLEIPRIELDSLHWLPGWRAMEDEPFRALVTQAIDGPAWITDGNYGKARDIIWERATTIVWLDYRLPVIIYQLFRRTVQRITQREVLWNGNRETWKGTFLSKDSLFLWALHTHPLHRKEYPRLLALQEYAHLRLIHLRSRAETTRWVEWLARQPLAERAGSPM